MNGWFATQGWPSPRVVGRLKCSVADVFQIVGMRPECDQVVPTIAHLVHSASASIVSTVLVAT